MNIKILLLLTLAAQVFCQQATLTYGHNSLNNIYTKEIAKRWLQSQTINDTLRSYESCFQDNCKACQSTYIYCDECEPDFLLDPVADADYGICSSTNACPRGRYLNTFIFSFCNLCFPTCDYCSSSLEGSCSECSKGFYFENDECRSCPLYCEKCDGSACSKCKDRYYLNPQTNMCSECKIDKCWDCQNGTVCKNCFYGYSLNGTVC